jgi:hypothetical protein
MVHDEGNIISLRNVVVKKIVIFVMFKMEERCKCKDFTRLNKHHASRDIGAWR